MSVCSHCGMEVGTAVPCDEHNWWTWRFLQAVQLWGRSCRRCSIWETQETEPEDA